MKTNKVELIWGVVIGKGLTNENPFRKSTQVLILSTPTLIVVMQPCKKGHIVQRHEVEEDLLSYIKPLETVEQRDVPLSYRKMAWEELCRVHEKFATDVFNHEY